MRRRDLIAKGERPCKSCKHVRRDMLSAIVTLGAGGWRFAKCAAAVGLKGEKPPHYCRVERIYDPPWGCGRAGKRFEPRP